MGENIYMLPSDMNLKIRSGIVGYNNKILVFDSGLSLGRNDAVNTSVSEKMTSHKKPISLKHAHKEVSSKHTPQPGKQNSQAKRKRSF